MSKDEMKPARIDRRLSAAHERIEELERNVASRDAEVAELKKEAEEDSALRERLAKILAEVAIALKGQEPALTRHSWHDLAQCAIDVVKERDQLREQVKMLRDELLWHKEHTYNPFEPDNQCNANKRICKALAATEPR